MEKAASAGHSDRCRIVVDTCCDFSPEVAANLDVDILGFPFIIDGEERTDDIWSSMSPKEFYDRMRAGARVSTSAVSLGRYIEFFTECAKEGTPTVYLCFTSALSSSYNSACQAADAVRAEYPDFELYVVDNALPCATGELLALEAVRQRSAGLTAKQLVDWANEAKTYVHGYFTLENFDALAAGGRIPPAAAQLTAKLDVKPELSYDLAGSLSLIGVNRGRKKALKSILKSFRENYVPDRTMPIAIMTADAEKDGDWLEAAIRKEEGCADVTIIRSSVGPTIGSHVGPGMVVEVEADNHFQVFLGGCAHKWAAYLYKSLWLMLCGFIALVLAMVFFGVGYDDVLDKNGLEFWGYCKGAILLWLGAVPLYLEHLLLQFQWPKTVSMAVGVAEFVISALFLTGLGDGLWPLVPCSWSARLADTYAVSLLMPGLSFPPMPWLLVLPLLGLFGIISVWMYRYEGRACHD